MVVSRDAHVRARSTPGSALIVGYRPVLGARTTVRRRPLCTVYDRRTVHALSVCIAARRRQPDLAWRSVSRQAPQADTPPLGGCPGSCADPLCTVVELCTGTHSYLVLCLAGVPGCVSPDLLDDAHPGHSDQRRELWMAHHPSVDHIPGWAGHIALASPAQVAGWAGYGAFARQLAASRRRRLCRLAAPEHVFLFATAGTPLSPHLCACVLCPDGVGAGADQPDPSLAGWSGAHGRGGGSSSLWSMGLLSRQDHTG